MNAISGIFKKELSPEDIAAAALIPKAVTTPPISKIRDIHHSLASALASGMKEQDVALALGYSQSRISILKNDPTFQELLEFYRGAKTQQRVDDLARFRMLARSAVAELQDRLAEAPELMTEKALIEIAAFGADRSGLGPTTKSININSSLSPADIAALKEGDVSVKVISPEDREARARRSLPDRTSDSLPFTEIESLSNEEGAGVREESPEVTLENEPQGNAPGNVVSFPMDTVPGR